MNALKRSLEQLTKEREKASAEFVFKDSWRLGFHLMPPVGWLNDPNGLCQLNGEYHVFFQYTPFDAEGGLKLWGHYKSSDLITWTYLGAALFPDQPYDCHGAYSGSACVEDGVIYLYYTGNVKHEGQYDYITEGRGSNTILVECRDGIHLENKRCIMENSDYPSDLTCHIRDPKVWREGGTYYMVQGARTLEDIGQVLIFSSTDKIHWELFGRLKTDEPFGYMWECPDLFELSGKWMLSVSPQGLKARGWEFNNIYQSGYFVAEGEWKSDCQLGRFTEWDRGFDFYAPQTFSDEQGRRIMIGWMGLPDCEQWYRNPTVARGWQHALTIPRVLSYENGVMHQNPPKEYEELRKNSMTEKLSGQWESSDLSLYELIINNPYNEDVNILIANGLNLYFHKTEERFTMRFTDESGYGREERNVHLKKCSQLRIFVDYSSVEVFINEGAEVFTTRYYPKGRNNSLRINMKNGEMVLYELKEMKYN